MQLLARRIAKKTEENKYNVIRLRPDVLYWGDLVLVNRNNPINRENESINRNLNFPYLKRQNIILEQNCFTMLLKLLKSIDAFSDIVLVSGYRSLEEQRDIYSGSLVLNGADFTNKFVAYPGESEHHTGLAVDLSRNERNIDLITPNFPKEGIYKEFRDRAAEFGFIERYSKGKEQITGIEAEPWHFRYVGYPHSQIMDEMNMCLEEYIDFIKEYPENGKHYIFKSKHETAEIFFVEIQNGMTMVSIPKDKSYRISGNNIDGYIVTIFNRIGVE